MFEHHVEKFDVYEKHILHNPISGNKIELLPNCGSLLLSARLNGVEVIDGYQDPAELEDLKFGKSLVLFPFPNRLDGGKYTFEGKNYKFPINNVATENAIHGLDKKTPFYVSSIVCGKNYAEICCRYDYEGLNTSYPFPFQISIDFTISDDHEVEINMTMINKGLGNLPAGLGWHPYFKIADHIEEVELSISDLEMIEINERMLPTGNRKKFDEFVASKKVANTQLDNCFFILNQAHPFQAILNSALGTLKYWQETGNEKFNFIQIFTPAHRKSIALEPMTCNIDAFNNGDGLKILAQDESLVGKFGFSFKKKY
ncbi:MAG: aldose 1-epimerase [Saprospiraceae bacterium]